MLVSIVIPVYNVEAFLARCLDSVLGQTHTDLEIICVNDGSTDESPRILQAYAAADPRIVVINQENRGLPGARNRGMAAATADYIAFLDSDDLFEVSAVEKVLAQCLAHDADMCVFRLRTISPYFGVDKISSWTLGTMELMERMPISWQDLPEGELFRFFSPSACNKMFRRKFLTDAGLTFHEDLKRAEDLPFTYAALVLAHRVTVVDEPLYQYHPGPTGLMATIDRHPEEICESLLRLRRTLESHAQFDRVEREFVNVALGQMVYTLRSLRTTLGYTQLYESLVPRWFPVLGLSDRTPDYFFLESRQETYVQLLTLSASQFAERQNQETLEDMATVARRQVVYAKKIKKAKRERRQILGSRAMRIGRFLDSFKVRRA